MSYEGIKNLTKIISLDRNKGYASYAMNQKGFIHLIISCDEFVEAVSDVDAFLESVKLINELSDGNGTMPFVIKVYEPELSGRVLVEIKTTEEFKKNGDENTSKTRFYQQVVNAHSKYEKSLLNSQLSPLQSKNKVRI